ncbi:hypothetical protein LF296_12720 [Acinetobacter vivianii]|uniref:Uncharacterized protein n=1 Tax=Acinetobacter vivianii TaxID=1776742 RepID=A0AAJ6P458_9GAMM|nr:hypothetical protein [Acinetobacter vivianii]WDZ50183.1 hypothetical protein LF296_12720 [Acinetobacter vivianii]
MPKYIAKQSVGHFLPGEEIKGLDAERIQALLTSGAIEEYKPPEKSPSSESTSDLKQLLGEGADLNAKITKLETDLAAATAKFTKAGKATADENADKGTPEAK